MCQEPCPVLQIQMMYWKSMEAHWGKQIQKQIITQYHECNGYSGHMHGTLYQQKGRRFNLGKGWRKWVQKCWGGLPGEMIPSRFSTDDQELTKKIGNANISKGESSHKPQTFWEKTDQTQGTTSNWVLWRVNSKVNYGWNKTQEKWKELDCGQSYIENWTITLQELGR